jgi:hypothetical protein
VTMENGSLLYLNSGDWVENLTALEYENNRWKIIHFANLPSEILVPKIVEPIIIAQPIDDKVLIFDLN